MPKFLNNLREYQLSGLRQINTSDCRACPCVAILAQRFGKHAVERDRVGRMRQRRADFLLRRTKIRQELKAVHEAAS